MPLIVHWPGNTVPGSVSDVPVMGANLYPTLVELAGEAARPGEDLDGKSLAPLLRGETGWEGRDLFWYYPHYAPVTRQPGAAIRSGDFKLIQHYDPPGIELYDLARDIGEQRDLSGEMPGKARQLQERTRDLVAGGRTHTAPAESGIRSPMAAQDAVAERALEQGDGTLREVTGVLSGAIAPAGFSNR